MKFAQITNGIVDGLLDAESRPAVLPAGRIFVALIGDEGDLIGARYAAGVFTRPPERPPAPKLSRLEFMGLLTPQERIGLRTRAASDPVLADALALFELAAHVEPAHPLIVQMLGYAEQIGVMTAARRAEFTAAIVAVSKVSGG